MAVFLKFRVPKSRSRDLGFLKISIHGTFNYCHVISKIQLSMFNRFLVISKSINFATHLLKWPNKNKGPTRAREVPTSKSNLVNKIVISFLHLTSSSFPFENWVLGN